MQESLFPLRQNPDQAEAVFDAVLASLRPELASFMRNNWQQFMRVIRDELHAQKVAGMKAADPMRQELEAAIGGSSPGHWVPLVDWYLSPPSPGSPLATRVRAERVRLMHWLDRYARTGDDAYTLLEAWADTEGRVDGLDAIALARGFKPLRRGNPAPTERAEAIFGAVLASLRPEPARFMEANRDLFLGVIEGELAAQAPSPPAPPPVLPEADLWAPAKRTEANLKAMEILATKKPEEMTQSDRMALAMYSGWGGLSIHDVADRLPPGLVKPEERGLIHEYYTPSRLAVEVARVIAPYVGQLPRTPEGGVLALEPSAGIGRFVNAASGPGFEGLTWLAVEWSELSGRMLQAMRPDIDVYIGPFERWIRERGPDYIGKIGLVLANPPYGKRGPSKTEDPDRSYRDTAAYHYFLRRGLDTLAPGGLGVFLVPAGFLTGQGATVTALREKVLKRHHLMAAYRLPSATFPGALLVTDLLFFQSRGGELAAVDEADRFILEGDYFKQFPTHILGEEVGADAGEDVPKPKGRFAYQIKGEFVGLPDLTVRPMCADCAVQPIVPSGRPVRKPRAAGVARVAPTPPTGEALPEYLTLAAALGQRVDRYLAAVAAQESDAPVLLWTELNAALNGWRDSYGNPWADVQLRTVAPENTGLERFLTAFSRTGNLIPGLATAPTWTPRYNGRPDDVVAVADFVYRTHHNLTLNGLTTAMGGRLNGKLDRLLSAGWYQDGTTLVPERDYLTGDLWPKYDRAKANGQDEQAAKLLNAIAPAVFDDIEGVSPRQGWTPLSLVEGWFNETFQRYAGAVSLIRQDGLVQVSGQTYENVDVALSEDGRNCLGWINHDKTLFRPSTRGKRKDGEKANLDDVRLAEAKKWEQSFRAWVAQDPERTAEVTEAYNRKFRGYVAPTYATEPLDIGRWKKDGPRLHPYVMAGARRVLANRGGLIAFDVGLGKTFCGIAVIAHARQEGWVRRPVVVVPNSIVWQWEREIHSGLPDYRVAIIGSKLKTIMRGPRKGQPTSETDTPAERAEKWTRFQAGEYDVVLLTYTALARTRMNEAAVREYADATEAIKREVRLRQRNAEEARKPTERQMAILKEGIAAWIAEQMELPEGWEYDPGIAWDDIGIDMLIVDEAQNFKNLYLPEPREGGVPKFMGNAGEGSKRAWQLDFRTAAIRKRTGGSGIVLLSATPAKNSPLEFYNIIQYIDHDAWSRMGIFDPEQFIDRYVRLEIKPVVDLKMEVVERSAAVGFMNLNELREVIFRYGEFKTAEDVKLKQPDAKPQLIEVDMDAAQDAKYDIYVQRISEALESTKSADKAKILGLMARLSMVAIHADLDGGYDWKTAAQALETGAVNAHAPKFDALAAHVLAAQDCGHIVFVENIAAHVWIRQVLIEAGIPADRVAILNADVAKASADRQRIANDFNGKIAKDYTGKILLDEVGRPVFEILPKYDVVIANQIAYEGISLQTRTCSIHHMDLPWEPATLQQRNGRGVRQGNFLTTVGLYYYFSKRSMDGARFSLIQGKLGWMTDLLKSQKRDTNNPGAQMELGPEEILLLISRDPEKTAAKLAAVKAKREEEARRKIAEEAARMLRGANARFRQADRTRDPDTAKRLRLEAEERLKDLEKVDPAAWPWARWMYNVRDRDVFVPADGGALVFEGLRVGVPDRWNPDQLRYGEFGRRSEESIGFREAGSATWREMNLIGMEPLRPEHLDPATWPTDDDARMDDGIADRMYRLQYDSIPETFQTHWASDVWLRRFWERYGRKLTEKISENTGYYARIHPVFVGGVLRLTQGPILRQGIIPAPTLEGWQQFLAAAPTAVDATGVKASFTELQSVADFWWGRKMPRGILASGETEGETS